MNWKTFFQKASSASAQESHGHYPTPILTAAAPTTSTESCSQTQHNGQLASATIPRPGPPSSAPWKGSHTSNQRPDLKTSDLLADTDSHIMYSPWLPGNPLAVWNSDIPLARRHGLLGDLADFLLQVWTVRVPESMVSTTPLSYSAWLTESLDRGLRRTLAGTANWGDAVDYLIMRSMIPDYAGKWDGCTELGFAHGDLNACNVMVDEVFRLTGVIDWDWIQIAPLPAVVHHPWFIADIPGWNNDGVTPGESFEADRAYLEREIRKKKIAQHPDSNLKVSDLLSDSTERLFFQSAFHFRGIHREFVRLPCVRSEENLKAAKAQLDAVLEKYPTWKRFSGLDTVKDVLG